MVEAHRASGGERRLHAGGVLGLDADDVHLRPDELDVRGDARRETAAADRHVDRADRAGTLPDDLHGDRPLPGDDVGVVEGVDEHQLFGRGPLEGVLVGGVEAVAEQDHLGAELARPRATLIVAVVVGITTTAATPRCRADMATPWAWLPADAQITPRARSARSRAAILLWAPRSLNEKASCRSSRFSSTSTPRRLERWGIGSRGVSTARS